MHKTFLSATQKQDRHDLDNGLSTNQSFGNDCQILHLFLDFYWNLTKIVHVFLIGGTDSMTSTKFLPNMFCSETVQNNKMVFKFSFFNYFNTR